MEHAPLPTTQTRASTQTALLHELDQELTAALQALAGSTPARELAAAHLLRAREVLTLLRGRPDDGPGQPPADVLALVRRLELPPHRGSARRARTFAGQTCEQWALPAAVRTAAVDIASELVTNAAAYGTGPVVLALERGAANLLVRVWDDGPGLPRVLPYRPGVSEKGLGLRLVQRLSSHWGAAAEDGGKWVWARIPLPSPDG